MVDTHTVIRAFKLNQESLDQSLGRVETKEPPKVLSSRIEKVVGPLEDRLKKKGYEFFVSTTKLYRGLPERVLVLDPNAPFMPDEGYDDKVDNDFLEVARELELPYEPEDRFIDYGIRSL